MTGHNKTNTDKPATRVHWREIVGRLERAQAAVEQATMPPEQEKKRILKERAKALAGEVTTPETKQDSIEILEFIVGPERYGMESAFVREVYPLKELTPLPGMPAFILGIINVRGRIISVIDPKRFFGLPEKGLTDLNTVILISDGKMEFGLLADAVLGVSNISLAALQPPLPTLTGIRADYLKGVASEQMAVLDAARLLADERMLVHQKSPA